MDGRGRALDNVFVERLWRSVKYEAVPELEKGLREYFTFYNRVSASEPIVPDSCGDAFCGNFCPITEH
jgi:hypothetical protein